MNDGEAYIPFSPEAELSRQRRRARERQTRKTRKSADRQLHDMAGGLVDGKRFDEFEPWNGRGLPTRENCDLSNPRQAMLWTFTSPPAMKGAPLILPTEYWELMSWRQWVLGIRPAEEPGLEWHPPATMAASPFGATGDWKPLGSPRAQSKTVADLMSDLPQQDRAEVQAEVLRRLGFDPGEAREAQDRPGPPAVRYTVAALAKRMDVSVPDLLAALAKVGLSNLHEKSRVGRDVAERLIAGSDGIRPFQA